MALTDNLISYWKCDEASGDLLDAHGSNNLTDTNTVTSTTGKINTARQFTRASNEYFIASSTPFQQTDISFSAWIKADSFNNYAGICMCTNGGSWTNGYGLFILSSQFNWFVNGYSTAIVSSTLSTATWYHVVGTYDSATNTLKLYVNGSQVATTSRTAPISYTSISLFEIGYADSGTTWDGAVDESGIWSRALSSGEVTSLYNSGAGLAYPFSGGGPAFIASWITA